MPSNASCTTPSFLAAKWKRSWLLLMNSTLYSSAGRYCYLIYIQDLAVERDGRIEGHRVGEDVQCATRVSHIAFALILQLSRYLRNADLSAALRQREGQIANLQSVQERYATSLDVQVPTSLIIPLTRLAIAVAASNEYCSQITALEAQLAGKTEKIAELTERYNRKCVLLLHCHRLLD